jgi:hypothetical protein
MNFTGARAALNDGYGRENSPWCVLKNVLVLSSRKRGDLVSSSADECHTQTL